MSFSKFAARRRGFTLIEMLIVIVVIAILALIVIPNLMGAGRKAKEATLRANIQELRNAVANFNADTGVYPAALTDVVAASTATPTGTPAGTYKGPYLTPSAGINGSGLPLNPFVSPTDVTVGDHWTYDATTGAISSTATGTTLDGVAYTAL